MLTVSIAIVIILLLIIALVIYLISARGQILFELAEQFQNQRRDITEQDQNLESQIWISIKSGVNPEDAVGDFLASRAGLFPGGDVVNDWDADQLKTVMDESFLQEVNKSSRPLLIRFFGSVSALILIGIIMVVVHLDQDSRQSLTPESADDVEQLKSFGGGDDLGPGDFSSDDFFMPDNENSQKKATSNE